MHICQSEWEYPLTNVVPVGFNEKSDKKTICKILSLYLGVIGSFYTVFRYFCVITSLHFSVLVGYNLVLIRTIVVKVKSPGVADESETSQETRHFAVEMDAWSSDKADGLQFE